VTLSKRDCGSFRTPSLRDLAVTGPYMQDGNFRTLDDVVAFYNAGGHAESASGPDRKAARFERPRRRRTLHFLQSPTDEQYEYHQTQ
jgi:cytochrome c peroxidase